jgi:1,4-alpha-glucan branching enzyme
MTKTTKGRRRITFTFEEVGAGQVILTGDFNQWDIQKHPMQKKPDGMLEKIVMLPPGRFEYKFKVDGQWRCDPANYNRCKNAFGTQNSVIVIEPK